MNHDGAGKSSQTFLSYARKDFLSIDQPLYEALKKAGLDIWIDSHELQLGDELTLAISHAIDEACYGVVILCRRYFAKQWTQLELTALDKG